MMGTGPTTGATESTWRPAPVLAFVIRATAYGLPVVLAYLVIRTVASLLYRPAGWFGLLVWLVQAGAIGAIVSRTMARGTRRLLPLATLYTTTLVFPDRAPSRFGVALRAGTVKQMQKRGADLARHGLGATHAEAAENAIVLVTGLGRHDRLTRGHTERVRAYADLIGEEMGLSGADRNMLAWGVLLHDVGKMTVPPEILNKVEKLTDDEWLILRNHPGAGAEMLEPLAGWLGEWIHAAGQHHERWDGRGYPLGIAGAEIARAGRITAVADAYDVITSKRSYKEPISAEAARRELANCGGSQFDPAVVRAFMAVSLGRGHSFGTLGSLFELPFVRSAGSLAGSPAAAVIGASAVAAASLIGLGDDSVARRSAFASELSAEAIASATPTSVDEAVDSILRRSDTGRSGGDITVGNGRIGVTPPPAPVETSTTIPSSDPTSNPTSATVIEPNGSVAPGAVAPVGSPTATTVIGPSDTVPPTSVTTVTTVTTVTATPSMTSPSTTLPSTMLPSTTLPSTTVPSVTLPSVTVPSTTLPSVTVPSVTIPSVSTPIITTPPITTPPITTPPITIPSVPLPIVTIPELGL